MVQANTKLKIKGKRKDIKNFVVSCTIKFNLTVDVNFKGIIGFSVETVP